MGQTLLLTLLLIGFGGAVYATSERSHATRTVDKTIPLAIGGSLRVENENGGIDVRSWNKPEIKLFARIRTGGRDDQEAEELLQEVDIKIESSGKHVDIYTDAPRRVFQGKRSVTVSYELTVPEKIDLDLRTVNGRVDVDGIAGEVRVTTTNGGVDVRRVDGAIQAATTNGGIHAELLTFNGRADLEFRTTNGAITVTMPKDVKGTLDAETTNGAIDIDFPVTVQGRLSKRSIRGELNGGGPVTIMLHTTNGSIRVRETF